MKKAAIVALHIGYWVLYLLLIVCFLRLMAVSGKAALGRMTGWNSVVGSLWLVFFSPVGTFSLLPGIIGFYGGYTVLFTRCLRRKRIAALFVAAMGLAVLGGVGTFGVLYVLWIPRFFMVNNWLSAGGGILFLALLTLVHGAVGLVLRGFITSYEDIQLKEDLNRKNYEMELALIKSQLNPHFLFNTINNIDVLIGMDAERASAYLNKLSDIMRFMLYETKTEKILLAREMTYIEKYIDLQKIRTANPHYVNYGVEGAMGEVMIEPMLFMPFIENAFKHGDKKKENAITIRFVLEAGRICFFCENKFREGTRDGEEGGLGNGLIRKRLELLYPGRHELTVVAENETYRAKLILDTHAN